METTFKLIEDNKTVAEVAEYLLSNFNHDALVYWADFLILEGATQKKTQKIFEETLYYVDELEENDVVYFDYLNPGNGPTTRCGVVLDNDDKSILLYDWTVDGPRRFNSDYIENLFLLTPVE